MHPLLYNTSMVLIGQHGAGKSTIGKLLSTAYGLPYVGAGDLLRKIESDPETKHMLKGYTTDSGKYIDTETLNEVFFSHLDSFDTSPSKKDAETGFVIDGYPRKLDQLSSLLDWASSRSRTHNVIFVHVDCDEDVCELRIRQRGEDIDSVRKEDQDDKKIVSRFVEYNENGLPILTSIWAIRNFVSNVEYVKIDNEWKALERVMWKLIRKINSRYAFM